MKTLLLTLLLLIQFSLANGQDDASVLLGNWVKVNVTYSTGKPLPVGHILKSSYLRFTFKGNGIAFKTSDPLSNGLRFNYNTQGENLQIGFINYKILSVAKDTLTVLEEGLSGFDGNAVKLELVKENLYQNSLPLEKETIISDTPKVYKESEKIRAIFNADENFQEFLRKQIPSYDQHQSKNGFLLATFIVSDNGKIDSLTIHMGIDKKFDRQFTKAVYKAENYFLPAQLNGQN